MAGKKNDAVDEMFGDDEELESSQDEGGEDEGEELELQDTVEVGDEIEIDDKPTRRDRRRGRVVEMAVEEATRAMSAQFEQRLAEMRGMLEGALPQRQQGGGAPPPDQRIEQLNAAIAQRKQQYRAIEEAWSAKIANNSLTAEERKSYREQAEQLQEEQAELIAARAAVKMGLGNQPRGMSPEDVQQHAYRAFAQQRHSDVMGHQHKDAMLSYADSYFKVAVAKGKQPSQELQDEAMDAAREQFGMGAKFRSGDRHQRPAPTAKDRARMSSAGSGGGSAGGKTRVKVTKALVDMAETAFGHIKDPRKRIEHAARLMKSKGGDL
jgi:hypothetical protein